MKLKKPKFIPFIDNPNTGIHTKDGKVRYVIDGHYVTHSEYRKHLRGLRGAQGTPL